MKVCPKCNNKKSLEEYYTNARNKNGYSAYCKPCTKIITKEWRKNNLSQARIHTRTSRLLCNFGVTAQHYEQILEQQNHKCAICETPSNNLDYNLCVDHDHQTGKVRGLLCHTCNHFLGRVHDDVNLLENILLKSINYLQTPIYK